MRKILAISALLCAAACADVQVVSAQDVSVYVSPGGGGVAVGRPGPGRDQYRGRGYRDERPRFRERRCRTELIYRNGRERLVEVCRY
jgi:hypothetical protein